MELQTIQKIRPFRRYHRVPMHREQKSGFGLGGSSACHVNDPGGSTWLFAACDTAWEVAITSSEDAQPGGIRLSASIAMAVLTGIGNISAMSGRAAACVHPLPYDPNGGSALKPDYEMTRYLLLGSVACLIAATSAATALECPVASQIDDPAALAQQFLPADIDLAAPQAMQSAVFGLKRAGVSPDLIVDNLVAVHCAAIAADPNVAEADKAQRVEDFSTSATQLVFGSST